MTGKLPKLLVDALGAIDAAQDFVAGVALDAYGADKMRRSAVERQLEILGEACARLARARGIEVVEREVDAGHSSA